MFLYLTEEVATLTPVMRLLQPSERVGSLVAGKYRIERVIGQGGMGAVFEALHVQMARRVAIKMLRAELVTDRGAVERFLREAQSAASVQHPSIVQILDFGEAEDGAPYIVMAYLDGQSLAEELYRRGRYSELEAVHVLAPIANALERAHQRGIIHRDIKPENVFLARDNDRRERPVLVDFGVSKHRGEREAMGPASAQGPVAMLGTPAYMAPEQITAAGMVDARTDIYAMGVLLYELLTGVSPFQRENSQATVHAILTEGVRSPSLIVSEISPAMEAVVLCAMARDPQHRFPSMEALQHALQDVLLEPGGSPFIMSFPLARAVIQARAIEPRGAAGAIAAGAERADTRQQTVMIVVGPDGSTRVPTQAQSPTPGRTTRVLGIVLAVLFFVGGVALLGYALLTGG